jgi:hypothetical protein
MGPVSREGAKPRSQTLVYFGPAVLERQEKLDKLEGKKGSVPGNSDEVYCHDQREDE